MRETLKRLRAAAVPRSEDDARECARKLDPVAGYVMYGLLYLLVVATPASLIGVAVAMGWLHKQFGAPLSSLGTVVAAAIALAVLALSWWPFVRWAKRRRRRFVQLLRRGELVRGEVIKAKRVSGKGGTKTTRVALRFELGGAQQRASLTVAGHDNALEDGTSLSLIAHAASKRCAVFAQPDELHVGELE
ncbi:MAG: hypothetical protein KC503_24115 [Myxococcales bacterium]|nr:hypothetical protein [Myxococcales bacterium]